jgi:AcrR family transcriptional regulator
MKKQAKRKARTMTRVPSATQRRSSYSSALMAQRRSRVLQEARNLIAEAGYDGVTMRLLAERSEVASATLYNIYGNKETLVASAVSELFEQQLEKSSHAAGVGLEGALHRIEWIADEILRMPEYTRAMVTVYFSTTADSTVRDLLRSMTAENYKRMLERFRDAGELLPWVDSDLIAYEIANQEYAGVHNWAIGRVPSEQLAARQKYTLLLTLGAITRGDAAEAVRRHLQACQAEITG